MRTVCVRKDLYSFDELSDEAKEQAVLNLVDINVDYEWWDGVYADAEDIGLKITAFDLDRHRGAEGHFFWSAKEVAEAIIENHGPDCETYKTAKAFLDDFPEEPDEDAENYGEWEDTIDDMTDEFLKSLLEDYSIMLQHESEYLTSDEAIIETIQSNEYEFTSDGTLY